MATQNNTHHRINTLHVNLWGNPGTGKSGIAGELYGRLNRAGYTVELVRDYARELGWRGDLSRRDEQTGEIVEAEQFVITAEQYRREEELDGKVQVTITDAPIAQGVIFAPGYYADQLMSIVRQLTIGWENLDIFLERELGDDYQATMGRIQSPDESLAMRGEIEEILKKERPGYVVIKTEEALQAAYDIVVDRLHRNQIFNTSI